MGKHRNAKQDEIILKFMSENSGVARGFFKGDKIVLEEMWSKLKDDLNNAGPPEKDIGSWKKVWLDWKGHIKRKLTHNKSEVQHTGGGNFNQFVLTSTEEELAVICGFYTAVDEMCESWGHTNEENIDKNIQNTETPPISPHTSTKTPLKRKRQVEYEHLMENETKQIENIGIEMVKLREIKEKLVDCLESIGQKLDNIGNQINNIGGKYEKIIEIKQAKLEESKKQRYQENTHFIQNQKHKVQKLEIQLQQIEIEKKKLDRTIRGHLHYDFKS